MIPANHEDADTKPGFSARGGLRSGFRPSAFADGDHALFAAGAAAAATYRLGARQWHFVGVEARGDYETPFSSGAAPSRGVFALGPSYELVVPLFDSGLSGQ